MNGPYNKHTLQKSIAAWLEEDMPFGDITSQNLNCTNIGTTAKLIAKATGIICGLEVLSMTMKSVDEGIQVTLLKGEGDKVCSGDLIAEITGPLNKILMAERLALNLLQRMSGIATLSAAYAKSVAHTSVKIADTRKTTPGLRQLEKYAVRVGGCYNHRFSLSDAVMIKDNHIKAAGSISQAIAGIRENLPHTVIIEVEVENLADLDEALANHVDIIMLDNMDNATIAAAVKKTAGRALLEASGNMCLERLPSVADTGVDIISVGALTHSAMAMDISLKFS